MTPHPEKPLTVEDLQDRLITIDHKLNCIWKALPPPPVEQREEPWAPDLTLPPATGIGIPTDPPVTPSLAGLKARLRNRTAMFNYGNGSVGDIPDKDCVDALAAIERLEEEVKAEALRADCNYEQAGDYYAELSRLKASPSEGDVAELCAELQAEYDDDIPGVRALSLRAKALIQSLSAELAEALKLLDDVLAEVDCYHDDWAERRTALASERGKG